MEQHAKCKHCGADAMLQTQGKKRRVNCTNYDACGIQTPWLSPSGGQTKAGLDALLWERWDRRA